MHPWETLWIRQKLPIKDAPRTMRWDRSRGIIPSVEVLSTDLMISGQEGSVALSISLRFG